LFLYRYIYIYIYIHIHTLHYITLHTYIPHKYIYIYRCAVWLVPNPCLPLFPQKHPPSLRIKGTIAAKKDGGKEFLAPLMKMVILMGHSGDILWDIYLYIYICMYNKCDMTFGNVWKTGA
jgi:hypothetical protein